MKRHPALQELSRDHHRALVAAQRLRRADDDEVAAAADEFIAFWREHGSPHFRVEEEVLLPRLAQAGVLDEELVGRMLRDHSEIRLGALAAEARSVGARRLQELGERLEAHVRLEERELFPAIEAALPAEKLTALARELSEAESRGRRA